MKFLLVDGGNIGYKCWSVMQKSIGPLTNNSGVYTTITFNMLRSLNAFIEQHYVDRCVICWDGGSKYRKKVFEWYKWNRKITPPPDNIEQYYEEVNNAKEYFDKLGVYQGFIKGVEADDILGYLSEQLLKKKHSVIIMSEDVDFFQLCKPHLKIFRPNKLEFVSEVEAEDRLKVPPKVYVRLMALVGQQKDNIPGACNLDENHVMKKFGFGESRCRKYLADGDDWLTLKGVFKKIENKEKKDKFDEQILRNRKQVFKSYKLSRIRTKESQYMNWENKKLRRIFADAVSVNSVKMNMVQNIVEFLELNSINVVKTLKGIGVKVT